MIVIQHPGVEPDEVMLSVNDYLSEAKFPIALVKQRASNEMYLKFKKEVAAKYEQEQSLEHDLNPWRTKPSIVSHIETDTAFRISVHKLKHEQVLMVVGSDTDKMPDPETKEPIHLADINLSLNEEEKKEEKEQLPS